MYQVSKMYDHVWGCQLYQFGIILLRLLFGLWNYFDSVILLFVILIGNMYSPFFIDMYYEELNRMCFVYMAY